MGVIELKQERARLYDEAQALLERAEREGRNLTESERQEWDRYMTGMDDLKERIERGERMEPIGRELEQRERAVSVSRADEWQTADGQEAAFLAPEQSLLDFAKRSGKLSPLDRRPLSFDKWLRGVVSGNWSKASDELEAMRAMSIGVSLDGGYAVPTALSLQVIDRARNLARVMQAGARTYPMETGEMSLLKVTTDPTAYWKVENAEATASAPTFGLLNLRAKTVVVLVKMSLELFQDAEVLDGTLRNALAQAIALKLDYAALYGTGAAEEPLGIYNTDGINEYSMGTDGAALTNLDPFSYGVQYIQEYNGNPNAVIFAPRTAGEIDRIQDGSGNPIQYPASYEVLRKYATNQVSIAQTQGIASNASDAFVGDFNQLLIAVRQNMSIDVSTQAADSEGSAFSALQVWMRAYMRVDVGVLRPDHFTVIKGIIPPS